VRCFPRSSRGRALLPESASIFNPFHSQDSKVDSWWRKASGASAKRKSLYQQVSQRLRSQAWFAIYGISPWHVYDLGRERCLWPSRAVTNGYLVSSHPRRDKRIQVMARLIGRRLLISLSLLFIVTGAHLRARR